MSKQSAATGLVLSISFTDVEKTFSSQDVIESPQLFTNPRSKAHSRTGRVATVLFFAAFLILAGASPARSQVFTKNQRILANASPATIGLYYDNGLSDPGPFAVGSPAHIIYGIGVTSSNTSTLPVSLVITLPAGFTPTSPLRCVRFPGGAAIGTPVPPTSTTALSNLPIAALATANDKEIVVIDGFFTQAGAYTTTFAATRGGTTESTSLNMNADVLNLPVDISLIKDLKPLTSGAFGSTASVTFGSTVTYRLTVKNLSNAAANHSTDVFLGPLLQLKDKWSLGNFTDVNLTISAQNFQCTSTLGAICPTMPGTTSFALYPGGPPWTQTITYPSGSSGLLPAQSSFVITFNAVITTPNLCSPGQNNKLVNTADFTYSNGTKTVSDTNPANNTAGPTTVVLTGIPVNCTPLPAISVTKTLLSPLTPPLRNWNVPFTYKITITNTSTGTLTALGLSDFISGSSTPPFQAINFSSVVCTPACLTLPTSSSPTVNPPSSAFLYSAQFSPLAPGATQTVQYQVTYKQVCASSSVSGMISNYVSLTGPASGGSIVTTPMAVLPLCQLQVTKAQTGGTSFSSFPAILGYQVQFHNNSSTPITVGTLIDAMAIDSQGYGNIPIAYSYSCTATGGVTNVAPLTNSTTATIQYNNPAGAGVHLINFSTPAGAVFAPGATLTCNISVTLNQPSASDSLCQGAGAPHLENTAIMDLSYGFNTNLTPVYAQSVTTLLPKCVSISVGKTVSPSVVAAQSPVTFTLTAKNTGNDPVSNIVLTDNVPAGFTVSTATCGSGNCSNINVSGNLVASTLTPIPAGATATVTVTATALNSLGTKCNKVDATFNPFPPLTYFEGDQSQLTTASACVQVTPMVESGRVDIEKIVENVPAGFAGTFNFNEVCTPPGGASVTSTETITFTLSDPLTTHNGLPSKIKTTQTGPFSPGTTCTVMEVSPRPSISFICQWLTTYVPTSKTVTVTAGTAGKITVVNRRDCHDQ